MHQELLPSTSVWRFVVQWVMEKSAETKLFKMYLESYMAKGTHSFSYL